MIDSVMPSYTETTKVTAFGREDVNSFAAHAVEGMKYIDTPSR